MGTVKSATAEDAEDTEFLGVTALPSGVPRCEALPRVDRSRTISAGFSVSSASFVVATFI